jgi:hypothetical protein
MEVFPNQPIRVAVQPTLSTSSYGLLLLYYPLVIIRFLLLFMLLHGLGWPLNPCPSESHLVIMTLRHLYSVRYSPQG